MIACILTIAAAAYGADDQTADILRAVQEVNKTMADPAVQAQVIDAVNQGNQSTINLAKRLPIKPYYGQYTMQFTRADQGTPYKIGDQIRVFLDENGCKVGDEMFVARRIETGNIVLLAPPAPNGALILTNNQVSGLNLGYGDIQRGCAFADAIVIK